ncbi:hypothetical protein DV515_00009572 [Chloebia gouldiae]|uniref:Uncharacterized protein n=1 Tax=Chloebia gouldiae TaxID=44316 RepID=A0A3L8SBW3_CHLGU|nr:hypothetical protein DV515_00009572 [Chloebia gouldiae]
MQTTKRRGEKKNPKPSAVSWLMLAARQIWHHRAGRQRVHCSSFRFAVCGNAGHQHPARDSAKSSSPRRLNPAALCPGGRYRCQRTRQTR